MPETMIRLQKEGNTFMKSMKVEYYGTLIELVQADISQVKAAARVAVLDPNQLEDDSGQVFRRMAEGDGAIMIKDGNGHEWYCAAGSVKPYPTKALLESTIYYYIVAPVWNDGGAEDAYALSSRYINALDTADTIGHASIAFPSIGTGPEGYPLQQAAPMALAAIGAWLRKPHELREIRLALEDEAVFDAYRDTLKWFLTETNAALNLNRYRAVFKGTTSSDRLGLADTDLTPSDFTHDLVKALGCPCLEFHQSDSMETILKTYRAHQDIGKESGFTPLLTESEMGLNYHVKPKDWFEEERKTAAEAAKSASSLDVPAWIKNELSKYSDGMLEYYKRDEGLISPVQGSDDFTWHLHAPEVNAWNIILACIPETKPWMLPFWIAPSNGYSNPSLPGDAPTMVVQMAFFKRWHEAYGAIPAVVMGDSWSLIVERPPETFVAAEALAWEHFAFCPEYDQMGLKPDTIRSLAEQLIGAKVWHFWWD